MPSTSYKGLYPPGSSILGGNIIQSPQPLAQAMTPRSKQLSNKPSIKPQQLFKLSHQRINIDVDLSCNTVSGFTELTIIPTSSTLKLIKLDCRELTIKDITINDLKCTNYVYDDIMYLNDPSIFEDDMKKGKINLMDLYSENINIHQHHFIKEKLNYIFNDEESNTQELKILLPENMNIELTDFNTLNTPGSHPNTATPMHLKSKNSSNEIYTPITIKITYELKNPQNGINFITNDDIDKKSWHAYTLNSDYNVSTSSWVPCIDNFWERCTWSLEISIPKSLKDIGNPRLLADEEEVHDLDEDDHEEEEENDDLDLTICSGDFNNVKETLHPTDYSKKVVSWSIFNPVCAHHVGWAIGCFSSFTLPTIMDVVENEDDDEDMDNNNFDEKDGTNSPITIYALPQDLELAKNTCIIANRALDYFSKEFGSFPFSSYSMVFVKFSPLKNNGFAGLSILSDQLLYPPNLIDPIFTTTDVLLRSMASQWAGINIVPQTFNDIWCTIGIAGFMATSYIKKLMGVNEYRFKIKKIMDHIVEEDIGKKPIAKQLYKFPVFEEDLDFLWLKAPIVLYILDNRMIKTDKSFGLSRVLPKLFLQAMSGELPNGTLTTEHFQYVSEKVNRNKLDNFFKQWVFGSGCPVFRISQRFNRKKGMVEMNIRQVQHHEHKHRKLKEETYVDDAIGYLDDMPRYPIQSVFTGPMTVRIHEADGSPYEHIVDLKDGNVKLDIRYNSKFRKIKKKDEGIDPGIDFNQFGDVLTSPVDMSQWNLQDWDKRDEESLSSEPFEWIRGDVDSEWISKIDVKQPDFMYGSQLIYDRDVEAQLEAIRYFGELEKTTKIYCTSLVRTVMDPRYFYGVRIAAAKALATCSNEANNFFGVGYLIAVVKALFCFPDSTIPKSNDFDDFPNYLLLRSIPGILSLVKDNSGKVPVPIQNLLLNLVKYNDNSMNHFDDCLYVAELIKNLTKSAISGWNEDSNDRIVQMVMTELNRLQKLDQWTPSYHNVIEIACIKSKIKMALFGATKLSFEDLLILTLDKYPMESRVESMKGLLKLGGLKNKSILNYFLELCLLNYSRPSYRKKLIASLIDSLITVAIHGGVTNLDDAEFKSEQKQEVKTGDNMLIIDEGSNKDMQNKHDIVARETIKGSIQVLRRDFAIGKGLKIVFWELLHSSLLSINEKRDLFHIVQILYNNIDSFMVKLYIPNVPVQELKKKIVAKDLGDGKIVFKREGRFKIQLANRNIMKPVVKPADKPLRISLRSSTEPPAPRESLVEDNAGLLTIKLPKERLKLIKQRASGPIMYISSNVTIANYVVKIQSNFLKQQVHRYIKIDTKRRIIERSKIPFQAKGDEGLDVVEVTDLDKIRDDEESSKVNEEMMERNAKKNAESVSFKEDDNVEPSKKDLVNGDLQTDDAGIYDVDEIANHNEAHTYGMNNEQNKFKDDEMQKSKLDNIVSKSVSEEYGTITKQDESIKDATPHELRTELDKPPSKELISSSDNNQNVKNGTNEITPASSISTINPPKNTSNVTEKDRKQSATESDVLQDENQVKLTEDKPKLPKIRFKLSKDTKEISKPNKNSNETSNGYDADDIEIKD